MQDADVAIRRDQPLASAPHCCCTDQNHQGMIWEVCSMKAGWMYTCVPVHALNGGLCSDSAVSLCWQCKAVQCSPAVCTIEWVYTSFGSVVACSLLLACVCVSICESHLKVELLDCYISPYFVQCVLVFYAHLLSNIYWVKTIKYSKPTLK